MSRIWFGAMVLAAIVGCAAESTDDAASGEDDVTRGPDLSQMNDVSVLYPLAKTQAEFDTGFLTSASSGARGVLLPDTLYTRATGQPKNPPAGPLPPGADVGLAWSTLKVVA